MIIYHLVIHGDKVTGETGGGRSVEWRVKKGERHVPNLQMLHTGVNFSVLKLCCPQDTGYDERMGDWLDLCDIPVQLPYLAQVHSDQTDAGDR